MKIRKQPKPDSEPSPRSLKLWGQTIDTNRQPPRARVWAFRHPAGSRTPETLKTARWSAWDEVQKAQGGTAYPCYLKRKAKAQIFSGFF